MLLVIPILALLGALSFNLILGRPRFIGGGRRFGGAEQISIIIPARDEEDNIGGLLSSIEAQEETVGEVVVVDDGSKDRTAELARKYGAVVVEPGPLPEGWKGKTWACQQGAKAAKGEWFLFLDADTRLEAGGLEKLAALAAEGGRVFSVCPYHRIRTLVEELSAFFNVLMVTGTGAFGLRSKEGEALFGQCLLISREHYEAVGGHERVRDKILENFCLAGELEALGIERTSYLGRGVIRMRMFAGGFKDLWRSWRKGFTSGPESAPRLALIGSSLWITGAMFAFLGAVLGLLPEVGTLFQVAAALGYAFFAAQCFLAFGLVGNFSVVNALFFPVSLMFYQILFFTAVVERKLGKSAEWKGRNVD